MSDTRPPHRPPPPDEPRPPGRPLSTADRASSDAGGRPEGHLIPRTREGRIATLAYLALFLLAMPPFTHVLWDRPGAWVAGWPFFFVALFSIYSALVGVLVWALRKGL